LANVDPREYLKDMLVGMSNHPASRILERTSLHWQRARNLQPVT